MLPAMMLAAAILPSAVPGMDRETTAQEASELLRGKWAVVYRETNGTKEADFVRLVYSIESHRVTATVNGEMNGMGRLRLVPSGRYFSVVMPVDFPVGIPPLKGQIAFRGAEFRWIRSSGSKFVLTVWQRQTAP